MKPKNKNFYRFAALMPVMEDGPLAAPTMHEITTLADGLEQARELAAEAGLTLLGQLDNKGNIIQYP